jgi:hypothetical protein
MASLGLVADADDDGNRAAQPQSNRSEGKPKRSAGAAAKKADPETGEVLHNLTKNMLDKIAGSDRQKFMDLVEKEHQVKIGAVPESKREAVEKLINEWGADRPFEAKS